MRVGAGDRESLWSVGGEDRLGQLRLRLRRALCIGLDCDRDCCDRNRYRGGVADWARSDATISSRSWAAA